MTDYETRPKTHHVRCECGFDASFASPAVATAIFNQHDEDCVKQTYTEHDDDE